MTFRIFSPLVRFCLRELIFAAIIALVCTGCVAAQEKTPQCSQCAEWNKPQAPFRIFGNSYYVGTRSLSSVLITSGFGHVLIDGDLPESVEQITANIRSLGFRIEDVKVLLNSHVHYDHAGGIAELQRRSGARVIASPWSAAVMRKGGVGRDDPQYGILMPIPPIKNVEELGNGQNFDLGRSIVITAHLTPGHTPGGTSWTWKSCEGGICHDMVYADSLSPVSADGFKFAHNREYPQALRDFETSFTFFETTPCEILVTAHPEFSGLWDRLEARERGVKPDPMVDPAACRQFAQRGRERLKERLAEEEK